MSTRERLRKLELRRTASDRRYVIAVGPYPEGDPRVTGPVPGTSQWHLSAADWNDLPAADGPGRIYLPPVLCGDDSTHE